MPQHSGTLLYEAFERTSTPPIPGDYWILHHSKIWQGKPTVVLVAQEQRGLAPDETMITCGQVGFWCQAGNADSAQAALCLCGNDYIAQRIQLAARLVLVQVVEAPAAIPPCTCDSMALMARGCTCGHLAAIRAAAKETTR